MHLDQSLKSEKPNENHSDSEYITKLQAAVNHFYSHILSAYSFHQVLVNQLKSLVYSIAFSFVRQASLICPISQSGKLKIIRDSGQLESILSTFHPVRELPATLSLIKSFRQLLVREKEKLLEGHILPEMEVLLPSNVIHHLFSVAGGEIELPHQIARRFHSLEKYVEWIDKHSEEEIWEVIKTSLDDYKKKVNARGDTHYSPAFPVILSLGQTLVTKFGKKAFNSKQ
eukprot:TRINITY_DN842_c0_g1_i1.p1 TRINITY_DN842_c0_g1~~TRINITY_DN842_c0_g1_i1.p1  ORF type:complete len:228 (-),score=42.90 TRINITY_DN842_c0_g1_i1:27-710(-)